MWPAGAWQREDGRTAAVLHEVFSWLEARQLARAGAVCRAWRRAAAAPALWRRLLLRHLADAGAPAHQRRSHSVSWRQEYVESMSGWALEERAVAGECVHGALAPGGARLALLAEDGALQMWARRSRDSWAPVWRTPPLPPVRGWRAAVRLEWPSAADDRLLVLGALALVHSWELLVLHLHEDGVSRVSARARCSAGAGGCWADVQGEAFLSLELNVVAPRLACTTVWLNAAEQETQSEYAGVRMLLLRIFNEEGANTTFAGVVMVPLESPGEAELSMLVTASGAGAGGALAAWPLPALRPPPVLAAELGDLRERVRRRAARPPPAAEAEVSPPPDEATVRALCTPPEARCALPAPPVGFILPPSGRCVWVTLGGGGACCADLPTLRVLRHLPAPAPTPAPNFSMLHYVQPSVSDSWFMSPRGAHSAEVYAWRVRSGAAARPPPSARPARPALATLLPPTHPARPAQLLVLTGEHLYVWRSRSTAQPADESLVSARALPPQRAPPASAPAAQL